MVTEEQSASPEAVGEAIRQLREASGWSREALAAELKIAPRQLAALEAGQWRELPNAIFVRGVLKGIARWGNRDPQPWLAVAHACFAESAVRLTPPSNAEGEIVVRRPVWRHPLLRLAGGVIVVALLLVGYLQWFGVWESDSSMDDGVSLRSELAPVNGGAASAVVVAPPQKAREEASAANPHADSASKAPTGAMRDAEPSRERLVGAPPSGEQATRDETPANSASGQQAAAAGPATQADQSGVTETTSGAPSEAVQPETSKPPQSAAGLVIRAANGDSWMRVTAADGTKVYDGILRQGNSRAFPADGAPYALHLGNAQALVIEWDGENLELPGRGVVRLQVPAKP